MNGKIIINTKKLLFFYGLLLYGGCYIRIDGEYKPLTETGETAPALIKLPYGIHYINFVFKHHCDSDIFDYDIYIWAFETDIAVLISERDIHISLRLRYPLLNVTPKLKAFIKEEDAVRTDCECPAQEDRRDFDLPNVPLSESAKKRHLIHIVSLVVLIAIVVYSGMILPLIFLT